MSAKSYYKTFIVSVLIVISVTLTVLLVQYIGKIERYDKLLLVDGYEDKVALEQKAYGLLVDKYLYLLKKEPKNYKIYLKLAKVYELQGNTQNAIKCYKDAITMSNSLAYEPIFSLAHCYLSIGEFGNAKTLVTRIDTEGLKELKIAKAKFYKAYADELFKRDKLNESLEHYKAASKYYREAGIRTLPEDYVTSASTALNLTADKCIEHSDTKCAIQYLNIASVFLDDAIAYYKLGLIYIDIDLNKSLKFIDMAFRRKPEIINFDVYEKVIATLINNSIQSKNTVMVKNYTDKLKLVKGYREHNFINMKDISVQLDTPPIYYDEEKLPDNVQFKVNIKNISKTDIENLYLTFVLKTDITVMSKYVVHIATNRKPLLANNISKTVAVTMPVEPLILSLAKHAKVEVYIARNRNITPVFLSEFNIAK